MRETQCGEGNGEGDTVGETARETQWEEPSRCMNGGAERCKMQKQSRRCALRLLASPPLPGSMWGSLMTVHIRSPAPWPTGVPSLLT